MLDAHCHLGFFPGNVEEHLSAQDRYLSMTMEPQDYVGELERFAPYRNVVVAPGLHPWRVAAEMPDARRQVEMLEPLVKKTALIGEVGLDFSARHEPTAESQLAVFEEIARVCAASGGKTASIHAVRSCAQVADILERSGFFRTCTAIFHWYSGPSDILHGLIGRGCLFSLNPRMLETRRGREYARIIPLCQLLLETDEPGQDGLVTAGGAGSTGAAATGAALANRLAATLALAAQVREIPEQDLADALSLNEQRLLARL